DLGCFHVVDEDRHGQCGHLLLGDDTAGVGVDHPVDLLLAQSPAVAFGGDDVNGVECLYCHCLIPSSIVFGLPPRRWRPKGDGPPRRWSISVWRCVRPGADWCGRVGTARAGPRTSGPVGWAWCG